MWRSSVLLLTVILPVLLALVAGEAHAQNVVLMVADDVGGGDLGCYGHPVIKTPNIDRLAGKGIRFTDAFATTASCSASRSVLYTGLHNHSNGQFGHAHPPHNFSHLPHVETLFTLLKGNGYRTGLIGKKHVAPDTKYPIDFEPRVNPRDAKVVGNAAAQFFSAAPDPFFLVVGFTDAHRAKKGFGVPEASYKPEEVVVPHFLPDQPEVREELAEYYTAIERLDQGVGAVLQALTETGKEADTLVIFLSDNGMPFPGAKTTVYDAGIKLPLLVLNPHLKRTGVSEALVSFTDITPTILDWTKTSLPQGYKLQGRSLLPILDQQRPEDWDEIFASHTFHEVTMYYPMRVVRNRKYKLIWNLASGLKYPHASDLFESLTWQGVLRRSDSMLGSRSVEAYLHRPEFELYDLEADPRELENRAEDPKLSQVRRELAEKLRKFQQETNDPWVVRYEY